MSNRITTLVWDLDGTLMDTLQDLAEATNHALRTYQLPEHSIDEIRQFVGNGVRRLIQLSVPGGETHPQFEEIFAEFKSYYMEHCKDHTCLYEGIPEVLTELKRLGYRMAIVSNKLQSGVDELYLQFFQQSIDVAIGECPGVPRKPAPAMVYSALRALGSEVSESLYIGDSDVDLATARNAGLPCISVLWGFRDRPFLEAQGATHFAEHPADILRMLQTLHI